MYKHIHGFLACHLVHWLTFFFVFVVGMVVVMAMVVMVIFLLWVFSSFSSPCSSSFSSWLLLHLCNNSKNLELFFLIFFGVHFLVLPTHYNQKIDFFKKNMKLPFCNWTWLGWCSTACRVGSAVVLNKHTHTQKLLELSPSYVHTLQFAPASWWGSNQFHFQLPITYIRTKCFRYPKIFKYISELQILHLLLILV